MASIHNIIYLRISGEVWALHADGSLKKLPPDEIPDNVEIHEFIDAQLVKSSSGRIDIIIDGVKHPIKLGDEELPNDGREYHHQIDRTGDERIAESGFDTSHLNTGQTNLQLYYSGIGLLHTPDVLHHGPLYHLGTHTVPLSGFNTFLPPVTFSAPPPVFDNSTNDWHHRDGAAVTIIIEDNEYPVGLDGYVNQFEAPGVLLHGTTTNIDDDRIIIVTVTDINGESLSFETLATAGVWNLGLVDLTALAEGKFTATAEVTDSFDKVVDDIDDSIKDVLAEGVNVVIEDVADGLINADEAHKTKVGGQFDNVNPGALVTITVTDERGEKLTFTTTLKEDGSWDLDNSDISTLKDGPIKVVANTVDQAGNPASSDNETDLLVTPSITIEIIDNDGVLNQYESPDTLVQGTIFNVEDGLIITVTVTDSEGNSITQEVIVDGGTWQTNMDLSSLVDGDLTAVAEVTNQYGDDATDETHIDLDQTAEIDVHFVDNDGVINAVEGLAAAVTGGIVDVEEGQPVDFIITDSLGNTITGNAQIIGGEWVFEGLDFSDLAPGELTVDAKTVDVAGNEATATNTIPYDPLASIDDVTIENEQTGYDDEVINKLESELPDGTTFSGTTSEIEPGQILSFTITDSDGTVLDGFTAVVEPDGSWTFDADVSGLVDGDLIVDATGEDIAGNVAVYQESFLKDTQAAVTIEYIQDDDYINQNEQYTVSVRGDVTDVEDGATVTVVLSDGTPARDITVQAVVVGGVWQIDGIDISSLDETALSGNRITATASVTDSHGNPATSDTSIIKDTILVNDIVTPITGDDDGMGGTVVNNGLDIEALKNGETVTIRGTSDAEINQPVIITFSNDFSESQSFTGQVIDNLGNWEVTGVTVTSLSTNSSWQMTALSTDIAGNEASDVTPALDLPDVAAISEFGIAVGATPTDTVAINTFGDDADPLDDYRFSTTQTALLALTSADEGMEIISLSDTHMELRTLSGELVLDMVIDAVAQTVQITQSRNIDHPDGVETIATRIMVETTQIDADSTTETVLSPVEVTITNAAPIDIPLYSETTTEAISNYHDLLASNTVVLEPARLFGVSVDTDDDGVPDAIEVVPDGGSVTVNTVKGDLVFFSDGTWELHAPRNLDHTVSQTIYFEYAMYDHNGYPAVGPALITVVDGAQGSIGDGTATLTEDILSPTESVTSTAAILATAGSDDVLVSSLQFVADVVTDLEALNLESSGDSLSYSLSADGRQITAFIGNVTNTVFTLDLSAAATADSTGNADIAVLMELFQPLDHIVDDVLTVRLTVVGDDLDGTSLLVGEAEMIINDGADPFIATPVAPADITETAPTGSAIERTGSIETDVGSDAIAALVFQDGATFPTLTSNGYPVQYRVSADGSLLEAYVDTPTPNTIVFTVQIQGAPDSTVASSTDYLFSLYDSLDQIAQADDTAHLSLPVYVIDDDGDSTEGMINIGIVDGTDPTISINDTSLQLSETPIDPINTGVPSVITTQGTVTAGSDRIVTQTFGITNNQPLIDDSGNPITQNGVALKLKFSGDDMVAYNPTTNQNVLVFNLTPVVAQPDGLPAGQTAVVDITVEVVGPIDHVSPDGNTEIDDLSLTVPILLTDSDGDDHLSDITVSVLDGQDPVFDSAAPILVSEVGLGNSGNASENDTTQIQLHPHSDDIVGYTILMADFDALNLTSRGNPVTMQLQGSTYKARADGALVFTVTINDSGLFTFKLKGPLDHPFATDDDIVFPLKLQAIDADGDLSPVAEVSITVEDDVPVANDDTIHVIEGFSTTGSVFSNDDKGADTPAKIIGLFHDTDLVSYDPGPDPSWSYTIFSPGVVDAIGLFTLHENGDYELTSSVFDSEIIKDLKELTYTIEDGDGDTAEALINLEIEDNGFYMVQPTNLEDYEDSEFLLDMRFEAGDVEIIETATFLHIDENSLDGGRLFLDPPGGGPRVELIASGGKFTLSGSELDYDAAGGIVKPNGNLIYIPAEDVSNANETLSEINPFADYQLDFTLETDIVGGSPREFYGTVDLSVISVADAPVWQDNGSVEVDGSGNVVKYIVAFDEDTSATDLDLEAISVDNDGSEDVTYRVGNIDSEIIVMMGTTVLSPNDILLPEEISQLSVIGATYGIAGQYHFDLISITTEKDNADTAETPVVVEVNITPMADDPSIRVKNIRSLEDQLIDLQPYIEGTLSDPDGSEFLSFELVIPAGWSVEVDGTPLSGTTVVVNYADITAGLAMLKPEQDVSSYNQEFTMQVTPIANDTTQDGLVPLPETNRGKTKEVTIDVTGVVDEPELESGPGWNLVNDGGNHFTISNIPTNLGQEDVPFSLDYLLGSTDLDHSEFSNVLLIGVPDGAYFSNSAGEPIYLNVVDFDGAGDPIYQISVTHLENLYITPPEDLSGILSFDMEQIITEPDGDSTTFTITTNLDIAPIVESSVFAPADQHVSEDGTLTLNLNPGFKDADGSEEVTDVLLSGLPLGHVFIIDGTTVTVDASGEIRLSDYSSDIALTLANNTVQFQPIPDFSGRFEWGLSYEVLDTAPGTGRTDLQTINSSIRVDVHPVVENETELVGTGDTLVSTNGSIDLTGKVQFTEADVDGSEWLDTITIIMPNNEDFFVTHPNGAIHQGNGEWIIDATGLTSSSLQDILVEIADGLVISSSSVGVETIQIEARVIDRASAWHNDSPDTSGKLTDGKVISTDITLQFNEPVLDGIACQPTPLFTTGEIVDGIEDQAPINFASHLNTDIAGNCDGLDNDVISFYVAATNVAHSAWIGGPGVVEEYDASGDILMGWSFTEAAIPTLELRYLTEHFAGTIDIPVQVIATDASGNTEIDNSQILKIEIAPVVDAFSFQVANNITVEEDVDTELGLFFTTADSNIAGQGIESIDSSEPITFTLLDTHKGTLSLAPGLDPALLIDQGGGVYTLTDTSLLANVRFRSPEHMDGQFRIQLEGKVIDVADGYAGNQVASQMFTEQVVINVEPVTDPVIITQNTPLLGDEDSYISLSGITIALADQNATHEINPENLPAGSSENLTILIESVLPGSTLYYDNGDGTYTAAGNNGVRPDGSFCWQIETDRLDDLVFKAPRDFSGDVDLTIKVYNYERGTHDYKSAVKNITVGVLPVADGSDAFADFDNISTMEGGIINVELNATIVDDDSIGHETVSILVNVEASSDPSAYYQLLKIVAPDGTEAFFVDHGIGSDPRLSALLEVSTQDLSSISIVTDGDANGRLDLQILSGSTDTNIVDGSSYSHVGGYSQDDITVMLYPEVDPPTAVAEFSSIAGLEGDNIPLSLMLEMVNPADTELGSIEISQLPAGYSIIGGTLAGSVWTVQEADIANAEIVGAPNLFGDFTLQIVPIAELSGQQAMGNPISIDVHVAELANSGPTTLDGTANDDMIYGNDDEQIIDAGAGADTLAGRGGDDIMTGGDDADRFVFMSGDGNAASPYTDTITDFDTKDNALDVDHDQLDLADFFAMQDVSTIALVDAAIDISYDGLVGTTLTIKDSGGVINENIVLASVTEDQLYGADASAATEAEILQKMIDDQVLVVNG
ncbi:T1SS-143 domain-containing protein [Sinobacterium caligoides]|uniref:T1SS-143 domain-containing protein n=1 Tax=Sinobacterium caligoides TaxID=933926 RepID=A0A3N2DJF9_9GAMM|nr:hypothetical protein [Sinobacterium caligoides]ROR99917.1 T1SS-143 domain-containing protein [Sinobacterium caligoides]